MSPVLSLLACAGRVVEPAPGEAVALAFGAHHGYVALGGAGLAVVDPATGAQGPPIPPPAPMDGVDDLSLVNDILVALDARPPGHVALYRIIDGAPALAAGPTAVDVAGVVGVSNHHGVLAVSGGAQPLTVMTYDGYGALRQTVSHGQVAEAQPDVLLDHTGETAFVTSRFEDDSYGITALSLRAPPEAPVVVGRLVVPGVSPTRAGGRCGFPLRGHIQDDLLYLGFAEGLAVVDVQDPAQMSLRAVAPAPVAAVAASVERDRAYLVGASPAPTLVELDIADPDSPRVLAQIPLPADAWPIDVAVRKGTVLVAAGPAGVLSFKRREPPDATLAQ